MADKVKIINSDKLPVLADLPIDTTRIRVALVEGVLHLSVVDVIMVIMDHDTLANASKYWNKVRSKIKEENSDTYQYSPFWRKLKLPSSDGKSYKTDVATVEGILRIIQSVPSPKVEHIKRWLAQLGKERLEEIADPSKALERGVKLYKNKGKDDEWIKARVDGILNRHKFTDEIKERSSGKWHEYANLTDTVYKGWSGMKSSEYKEFKGIKKGNKLRDAMNPFELQIASLSENVASYFMRKDNSHGFDELNSSCAKGGEAGKKMRYGLESVLGTSIITVTATLAIEEDKDSE